MCRAQHSAASRSLNSAIMSSQPARCSSGSQVLDLESYPTHFNPLHLELRRAALDVVRCAMMRSGSYTSLPAAGSNDDCGVRFLPVP